MAVFNARHDLPLGGPVAFELVGDHQPGRPNMLLQQLTKQALGRLLVAPALHHNLQHEPVLVDGAPQVMLLASMVITTSSRCHFFVATRQPPVDASGDLTAEFQSPLAHGFMADDDAAGARRRLEKSYLPPCESEKSSKL